MKFIPRDIGMWRGIFNFPPKLLPLPDYMEFERVEDFLQFLKDNRVRFDDLMNPFELIKSEDSYAVVQWTEIGNLECSEYQAAEIKKFVQDLQLKLIVMPNFFL